MVEKLTPEELEELHRLQRGLTLFTGILTEIENRHQEDMGARKAVAKRGQRICQAIETFGFILEGDQCENPELLQMKEGTMEDKFIDSPNLDDAKAIATWLNSLPSLPMFANAASRMKIIDWHIIPISGKYQVIAHVQVRIG